QPSRDGRRDSAKHDQPATPEGFARFGSPIRSKDMSQPGGSEIGDAGRLSGALSSIHCAWPAASQNALPASMSITIWVGGRPGCSPALKTHVLPNRSNHDPSRMKGD